MTVAAMPRKPSERNVEIYYAVMGDDASRVKVAKEYKISPQRVSKIVKTVAAWMCRSAAEETTNVAKQSYLAHDLHLYSLRKYKQKANAAFDLTCQPQIAPEKTATPGKWWPAKPDSRLLTKAMDTEAAIAETTIAKALAQARLQGERTREVEQQEQAEREAEARREERAKKQARRTRNVGAELAEAEQKLRELAVVEARKQRELDAIVTRSVSKDSIATRSVSEDEVRVDAGMETALRAAEMNQNQASRSGADEQPAVRDQEHGQARGTLENPTDFSVAPPAGAMLVVDENDPERRTMMLRADGVRIWLVETYDFGEDTSQPIEGVDGRCFAGKLMWRTQAEIDDEQRRRYSHL